MQGRRRIYHLLLVYSVVFIPETPCYQIKVFLHDYGTGSIMLNPIQCPMMTLLFFLQNTSSSKKNHKNYSKNIDYRCILYHWKKRDDQYDKITHSKGELYNILSIAKIFLKINCSNFLVQNHLFIPNIHQKDS